MSTLEEYKYYIKIMTSHSQAQAVDVIGANVLNTLGNTLCLTAIILLQTVFKVFVNMNKTNGA